MKLLSLLLLASPLVLAYGEETMGGVPNRDIRVRMDWNRYKMEYNKKYDTPSEENWRFQIWYGNLAVINKHNKEHENGLHTYSMGVNHFTDMTESEFRAKMNGYSRPEKTSKVPTFMAPLNVKIPDSVDWRTQGYVTPVKDQGHCGSCWAFSSTGSLEGQKFRKYGVLTSLSEQNLVDCSVKFGNHGCKGGAMQYAFNYIKTNDGVDTESTYPYEAKDDTCRFQRGNVGADDTGFYQIGQGDENGLQQAIATVGPISVAIDAGHKSFQHYKQGVYNEPACNPLKLDHGVLAVGYGTTADGQQYYIVKNSWSEKWGEKGYMLMPRNKNNYCGIATDASYPIVV